MEGDAGVADASRLADAARTVDSRPPDAAADARPDAGAPDAASDAAPDAGSAADARPGDAGCVSDEACGGKTGITCVDGETQQQCELVGSCFKLKAGTVAACTTNQSCPGVNVGCACDNQPLCDAAGTGAGTYCDPADQPRGRYACADVAGDGDACVVPTTAADCEAPTVCAEATAGAATCMCPAAGDLPDTGCTPGSQPRCASDDGSVVTCQAVTVGGVTCNVWTVVEDCDINGLTCENADCVCSQTTNEKFFFANPVVDRSGFVGLLPTGARTPAICSYPLLSQAITRARAESQGGFFPTFAVASDDEGPAGLTEVRFENEPFPLVVRPNVTVTTEDDPRVPSPIGVTMRLGYFKIIANSFPDFSGDQTAHADGFIWLRGADDTTDEETPGAALVGFEVEAAPCRFLGTETEASNCFMPESLVHITGYSAALDGGLTKRPNMYADIINGFTSGALALAQDAEGGFAAFEGVLSGGVITSREDGTFSYKSVQEPDPNDPRFATGYFAPRDGFGTCNSLVLRIDGAANDANNGAFIVVREPLNDDTIVLGGRSPTAPAVAETLPAAATATLYCVNASSAPRVGVLVEEGNAAIEDTLVGGFVSEGGVRAGIYVDSTFDTKLGVVINGGGVVNNDVGLHVTSVNGTSFVTVGASPVAGNPPLTASANLDVGVLIEDFFDQGICGDKVAKPVGTFTNETFFAATAMIAEDTFRPDEDQAFDLGSGTGIGITGPADVTLTSVISRDNAKDGVGINTDFHTSQPGAKPGADTLPIEVICLPDNSGSVLIESSTLSTNGYNGLHTEEFRGTIDVNGGTIQENGTDLGVVEIDLGEGIPELPAKAPGPPPTIDILYAVGNGILVNGCVNNQDGRATIPARCNSGFFTNADDAGTRLQVTGNVRSGIRAYQSSLYITATDIKANSTANLCMTERSDFDARDAAVVIAHSSGGLTNGDSLRVDPFQSGAVVHFTNSAVNGNNGTGVRLSTAGVNVDPEGSTIRPNTLADSEVNDNLNKTECAEGAFDPLEHPWHLDLFGPRAKPAVLPIEDSEWAPVTIGAGVHVRRGGRLQVTDGATDVDRNTFFGVYDNGTVDRIGVPAGRLTELLADPNDPNDPIIEVDGTWSIDGNGWNGFYVGSFANEDGRTTQITSGQISTNGADTDPNTPATLLAGFRMEGIYDVMNNVTVTGTTFEGNLGAGVSIETQDHACSNITAPTADFLVFTGVKVLGNLGSGVEILSAPGLSRMASDDPDDPNMPCQFLTEVPLNIASDAYGFRVQGSTISGNFENGITLSVGSAAGQTLAAIGGSTTANDVLLNKMAGLLMDGGDDGERVGATITNSKLHDNSSSGIILGRSIIVPFDVSGLGFKQNQINHNAMLGAGCTVEQTAAQIFVNGATAIEDHCFDHASSAEDCNDESVAGNNFHCVFTQANECVPSHDLRGSIVGCDDANRIFGFEFGGSDSDTDVGIRAEGGTAEDWVAVDARNNIWQSSPKSSVGQFATIKTDTTCAAIGCGN